jgi:hypothetical protein
MRSKRIPAKPPENEIDGVAYYFSDKCVNHFSYTLYPQIMKHLLRSGLLAAMLLMAAVTLDAQIVVNIRPSRPTVVVSRPPAPGPGYVWIDEDWSAQGNKYVWKGGYWAPQPKHGKSFNKGYWKQNKKGWHWVPGRWK